MSKEKYIQYISSEKRFSKHTIKAYNNDLSAFINYLESEYELLQIEDASSEMIRSWVIFLMENGDSPITINRRISALRSYYKYLTSNNLLDTNPVSQIKAIKTPSRIPKFLDKV